MNPSRSLVKLANASVAVLASLVLTVAAALVLAAIAVVEAFGGHVFLLRFYRPTPRAQEKRQAEREQVDPLRGRWGIHVLN